MEWKTFRKKYGLHDKVGIYEYTLKLLEDARLPKYASQSKLKTILKLQELRDILPKTEYSIKYKEAIDIRILKFNQKVIN